MKTCERCFVDLEETCTQCPCCGEPIIDPEVAAVNRKHQSIRILSTILKIFAVIVLLGSIYYAIGSKGIQTLYMVGGGIFGLVLLWTLAEMEKVFIDTEENTHYILAAKKKGSTKG